MEIKNKKRIRVFVIVLCISIIAIIMYRVIDDAIFYYKLYNKFYSRNIDEGLEEAVEIANEAIFDVDNYSYYGYDPYEYNLDAIDAYESNGVWVVDYTIQDKPTQIILGGHLTVKIDSETKEIISIWPGR